MVKHLLVALALLAQLGCGETTAPGMLHSSYFLSTVDGKPLPVSYGSDGSMLVGSLLDFGPATRSREGTEASGIVRYIVDIQQPDQTLSQSELKLNYTVRDNTIQINLCPSLAICITSMELAGPIGADGSELVLTYYLGGMPHSVYRYFAAKPD